MRYVDGFVIPVPKKNVAAYRKMAEWGKRMWMKHGALEYFECVGEDLHPKSQCPGATFLSFLKLAKAKRGETVFFSFIVYKSRAHRDQVNARVIKAMGKMEMPATMPFDVKRMAYGGFKALVQA